MPKIGDRVRRRIDGLLATVLSIYEDYLELQYDEGGSGWWPVEAVEVITPA